MHPNDALVIYEFLSRELDDLDATELDLVVVHDGETGALNALLCSLEKALDDPFAEDYQQLVEAARADCVSRYGSFASGAPRDDFEDIEVNEPTTTGLLASFKEHVLVQRFQIFARDFIILALLISHAVLRTG